MKNLLLIKLLKFEIEFKRKVMYKKAKDLGFSHPQVVNCSQELDILLNKYFKQAS
ncbi:stage 0 sporulation regulatory protein [Psychrobacillus insolitus]|uniref:Stage 0 sporulation regulatory protein n=1 Tax=Psychrobacillus insolitus TaxID=1461 RepID=A0A2W7N5S9_9BACI|nr:aspartyl-phosphate phosphatase Spo0E family protein [Psychrobacillus insolitus]PZX07293.1 stage 0 sporulation regulatory protein [Psychrobacillus insolitus]